jgi:hypothetical protein
MVRSILLTRAGVRAIPSLVTLTDGTIVPLQNFSLKPLPFFASPSNSTLNGNINKQGWKVSQNLGELLAKKYSNIKIRGNVSTGSTIDSAIAISKGAKVEFISIYNGTSDPLLNPITYYGYTLPESANQEQLKRYKEIFPKIAKISKAITETFGVPLPTTSNIGLTVPEGLLLIVNAMSQEPTFSKISKIDLNINKKNSFIIPQGSVVKNYVYDIKLYNEQLSSNICQYILNSFNFIKNNTHKENDIEVFVVTDSLISTTAAFLGLNFTTPTLPENYVNANSGLLITIDDNNNVFIEFLGLTTNEKFVKTPVLKKTPLNEFNNFVTSKINPTYVNLTEIENVINYRTT